jgi:RimJ/RimL family protein N-acetyltransferase
MKLVPPDTIERLQLVAGWLTQKENYQWLDFGDGHRRLSPEWMRIAMQRGTDVFRLFTADDDESLIGVVGLGNVNQVFKTAHIWVALGDRAYASRGYATRAFSKMLTVGFHELGLRAINTWCVEHNHSVGLVMRNGFKVMGRQRQCHYIDGRAYDRLWFDLLASEHKEI